MMPKRDPRDGYFCLCRTTMIDSFSCTPFIYLFQVTKCIQCVGFAITRPRYAQLARDVTHNTGVTFSF